MSSRRRSLGGALVALLVVAASTLEARPDDDRLQVRWKQGSFLATKTRSFEVQRQGATWSAEVLAPKDESPHKVTLVRRGGAWQLEVQARVRASRGAAGVVAEEEARDGWSWGPARIVPLEVKGDRLEAKGWRVQLPRTTPAEPAPGTTPATPVDPGALGDPAPELPVVRVVITGFDRFPRLRNHPAHYWGSRLNFREPETNPSSYGVRNLDLARIDPALRARCRIDLHRMVDVPVHYVEAAKMITDKIIEVDADAAISFGVGSDGGDADVEAVCFNRMSDGGAFAGDAGEGPWRLPASWPPSSSQSAWSAEDRAWLSRYPDNAGVSYNGKKICPGAPDTLRSSLPISAIAANVRRKGLTAIDDSSGPGNYICNNVMFEVVRVQASRGRIGGFVHLAGWHEASRDNHVKVVAAAVEESVKAVLAARGR